MERHFFTVNKFGMSTYGKDKNKDETEHFIDGFNVERSKSISASESSRESHYAPLSSDVCNEHKTTRCRITKTEGYFPVVLPFELIISISFDHFIVSVAFELLTINKKKSK